MGLCIFTEEKYPLVLETAHHQQMQISPFPYSLHFQQGRAHSLVSIFSK